MEAQTLYCECEEYVMDIMQDSGCRRCGRPVDFSPHEQHDDFNDFPRSYIYRGIE